MGGGKRERMRGKGGATHGVRGGFGAVCGEKEGVWEAGVEMGQMRKQPAEYGGGAW